MIKMYLAWVALWRCVTVASQFLKKSLFCTQLIQVIVKNMACRVPSNC